MSSDLPQCNFMRCIAGQALMFLYSFTQVKRGRPSQTSIIEKRKRYRPKKKVYSSVR